MCARNSAYKSYPCFEEEGWINWTLFLSWSLFLVSVQQLLQPVYMGVHKLTKSTCFITGDLIKTCFLTLQETALQQKKSVSSVALF